MNWIEINEERSNLPVPQEDKSKNWIYLAVQVSDVNSDFYNNVYIFTAFISLVNGKTAFISYDDEINVNMIKAWCPICNSLTELFI